ncbi:type I restriction-modification system subunit M [bacterium]|nr:type I restriction-modification system subunit M [bacterium]
MTTNTTTGTPISQKKINDAVWEACDAFRGTVAPEIYKDFVLTMLFLKYISDVWQHHYNEYQAEHGDEPELIEALLANERFTLPMADLGIGDDEDMARANFYSLWERREQPGNGERIDRVLHAIEEANLGKLKDVFQDISFNTGKLGDEATKNAVLNELLTGFASDDLDMSPARVGNLDVIGNAYEFLIKHFAATSGKKAGEFYTPPEVSNLMAELVAPQPGDQICDPACGSGSLLMKCGRQVRDKHGSKDYALFGQEAIGSTWALAKMNMFLHGEDNHRIEWGDTLRAPKLVQGDPDTDAVSLQAFDVVVANPPFSLDKWGQDGASDDKYNRFKRGVPPKSKGDYAFILHMVETLKATTGRMAVVVPHGVLFRAAAEGRIRKALIEENLLDVVIGLPEKLFYGTGIPAAILIFRKGKPSEDILFIDASRDFAADKTQNRLREEDLARVIKTVQERKSVDKYAHVASLDEIRENDFNLNVPRYVDTFEEEEEIELAPLVEDRKNLIVQLESLNQDLSAALARLGYDPA